MDLISLKNIVSAFLYSGIGLVVLGISFYIFDKITPGELWKEIGEKNNIPLAITTAAMIIGMSIIIAAAIHS
jgi:putative membrane protein